MQLERRRMVRRAFTGGVMLATAAMLPLSLLELGYALAFRHASVDSPGQAVRFGLYITLLLIWAGAMLGLLEGMLNLGIGLLTKFFAKRRVAEPRWMALIYSFLALPGIAMVTARIFSGRRASQIPGKDFIALGLGLMGLLAAYALFRLIIAARERFRLRRWGPREAMIISPALLLAAVLLYCADHGVLPRLYGWFHVGLFFLVVALLQLGVGACYVGFRPRTRWLSRAMEPGVSVLVLLAATAGGAWALVGIGASQPLRYLAFEHTAATAKILSGATALGLGRRRPPSPIPIAPAPKVRPEQPSLKKGPRAADSSVLLITVDALRADQLGAYGQERTISPRLDAWARSAVVFERGYCQVPHTSFSIASLMTGTYLHAERQVSPNRKHKTLAQALRHYGHKTAAFFPPAVFYIDREAFTPFERNRFGFEYVKYQYISAEGRVNQALDFLRKHKQQQAEKKKKKPKEKEQQIFIWVHFFEPHEPYEQKAGFEMGSGAMDRYRSEIAYVDHHVGRLIAQVRKELPRTIIALTADHGEEFGEHGGHYHGNALYEPQVRVPLVISAPGVAARKVHGAAQVIDLGPTILSLLDLSVPASMRGTDLGPWLAGEDPSALPPAFVEINKKKAIIQGDQKLICDFGGHFCELYDLGSDPAERRNLAGRKPKLAASLRAKLDQWTASHVPRSRHDGDEAEALRLLKRGGQGDASALPGLARLAETQGEVGRRAVRVLARMRTPAAKDYLVSAGKSRDPGVSIAACIGAALLGDAQCLSNLPGYLDRPDLPPDLRLDALLAQARAGLRNSTRELTELLLNSSDIYQRQEIIKALGHLGDPAATAALMKQLGPLRTRLFTIEALGKVGASQAVPALIRALGQDRFISWRRAAARALGLIGDPRAIPALRKAAARELERPVVIDAVAALTRLDGLPVPGTTLLPKEDWVCARGGCRLDMGVGGCSEGAGRELLLALTEGAMKLGPRVEEPVIKAAPAINTRPGAGHLTVRCGDTVVARLDLRAGASGAAAIPLDSGAAGRLSLTCNQDPPQLGHAALRPVPKEPMEFK